MSPQGKDEFVVKYGGTKYDISRFLKFHPGGTSSVAPFRNLPVDRKLSEFDHSAAAMYLMREYKQDPSVAGNGEPEDLERLVDWSKPMLPQVGALGDRYYEWMSSPVDRPLRLFESDLLESFTVTPWYLIPLIWLPASLGFLLHGYYRQNPAGISAASVLATLVLGVVAWSLLEYVLHRWVFHSIPPGDSPARIRLHFTIHGLHHKVPFDERRLLFPPVPAGIVVVVFYSLLSLVLPLWLPSLLAAGMLLGYVGYDLTHFYLHYGSPQPASYMYHMKRYHNRHHFTHQHTGFGISTDFWDRILGTEITLTKLKTALKW